MCGISGIIHFDKKTVEEPQLRAMMKAMKHRGPDDEGVWLRDNTGFGFVRLSILDLSAEGHQPMSTPDGRLTIIFNGEIYNYIELRKELSPEYTFHSKTDTEVLLYAYHKWGRACLDKLNGMFAFAIYDNRTKEIFIARDRFGIKPLYYYADKERFVFASEIPPILRVLPNKPLPEEQNIYDFLVYNRTNHNEKTFFKNIFKLLHGSYIIIKDDSFAIHRWYKLADKIMPCETLNADTFRDLFSSAVDVRLRSDVPVGSCLSGGLDSSAIVSMILKYHPIPGLNTFSAVYKKGQRGDESDFIELYEGQLKNIHFTRPTADSFLDDIDKFVSSLQEPVPGTSAYAEYKVYELAKQYVTVILNGQGADEEMAGYLYFAGFYYRELFMKLHWFKMLSEMYYDVRNHHIYEGPQSFVYFMLPASVKDKISAASIGYLSNGFASSYKGDASFLEKLYGSSTLKESLVNHFEYKFEHHLIWGDRSSMWFSLEARFPFLDYRLVEATLSLTNDQIINKGVTKVILREAMKGIVPDKIVNRMDKVGYETPEDEWFRNDKLKQFTLDILKSSSFKTRGYIDAKKALALYEAHLKGAKNASTQLWKMLHLELWFQKFCDA